MRKRSKPASVRDCCTYVCWLRCWQKRTYGFASLRKCTGSRLRCAFGWYGVSAALTFGSLNESFIVLQTERGRRG